MVYSCSTRVQLSIQASIQRLTFAQTIVVMLSPRLLAALLAYAASGASGSRLSPLTAHVPRRRGYLRVWLDVEKHVALTRYMGEVRGARQKQDTRAARTRHAEVRQNLLVRRHTNCLRSREGRPAGNKVVACAGGLDKLGEPR